MGIWRIGVDELAASRFVVSPMAETVAAFLLLSDGPAPPAHRAWRDQHRGAFRRYLDESPSASALVTHMAGVNWLPDYLSGPPHLTDRGVHDGLRRVRETPAEVAIADLGVGHAGPVPAILAQPDVALRTAELLDWVWTRTVRPDWPRRQRLFEADIVARTARLSSGGWAAALDGLRPGMRWLGDGQLQINTIDNPPRDLGRGELTFVPASARRGWVAWEVPHRYSIVYPVAGALIAEDDSSPRALSALLGPVRAGILARLASPASTSQLVAVTGYGLGTVGGHLKVLLDAQLVRRRRSGRSVLYYRTEIAETLLSANGG